MKKSKMRDIDHGWANVKKQMVKMKGANVRIGVLQNAGDYPKDNDDAGEPATLAEVAFYNEFGTKRGIPERPFIRATADEKRDVYAKYTKTQISKIFSGTQSIKKSLEKIGTLAQGHVRKKMKTLKTPPNAASTIAAKGSSNPLIDTSILLKSIDYEVNL